MRRAKTPRFSLKFTYGPATDVSRTSGPNATSLAMRAASCGGGHFSFRAASKVRSATSPISGLGGGANVSSAGSSSGIALTMHCAIGSKRSTIGLAHSLYLYLLQLSARKTLVLAQSPASSKETRTETRARRTPGLRHAKGVADPGADPGRGTMYVTSPLWRVFQSLHPAVTGSPDPATLPTARSPKRPECPIRVHR